MKKREKIIQLPVGNVQKMMKAFNASKVGIYNALAYRSNSERAQAIRDSAIRHYGGVQTTRLILR